MRLFCLRQSVKRKRVFFSCFLYRFFKEHFFFWGSLGCFSHYAFHCARWVGRFVNGWARFGLPKGQGVALMFCFPCTKVSGAMLPNVDLFNFWKG